MSPAMDVVLWLLTLAVLVPLAVLTVEVLAALPPRRPVTPDPGPRPRCAVLMPAHNEEAGIGPTVEGLVPQLAPGDRLVVVADNCTDRTAEIAAAAGATVTVRTNKEHRGKGYALDHGVKQLAADPPAVVIIVDADCRVTPGSLERLTREAAATGRPAQAVYLMEEPPDAGPKARLSAFAFRFRNLVRPLGLYRLGVPCLLTGSGMAFPWAVLEKSPLATGNIVEDMKLGLDLCRAGQAPRLCPDALVLSVLPTGDQAAAKQRKRWEHGHLQTLLTEAPRLLLAGLGRASWPLLGLALELSVPPLALLFLLWALVMAVAGVGAWLGASPWPAAVTGAAGLLAVAAIFAAWFRFGRDRLPFTVLLAVPFYVLWKVPIYFAFLFRRQKAWNRADRNPAGPQGPAGGG